MTQEVEHHLPGAQSFYDRLVSAKGPLEFNAAMEERLQEIDSDAFYHGYVLPAEAAILGIAARIMAENPAVTFQQALDRSVIFRDMNSAGRGGMAGLVMA